MKTILIGLLAMTTFVVQSQTISSNKPVKRIGKLIIDAKKSFSFGGNDSTGSVLIDTLIMNDKAALKLYGKKNFNLTVLNAFIGKKCYISGTDGKHNGTNLDLVINFEELGDLAIDVGGLDAINGTRTFPNGNGGKLNLTYLDSGIQPQFDKRRQKNFIAMNTRAGGYRVTPQSDLYVIFSRIGGPRGRPLSQLPQGQVYSGAIGRDGKADVKEVSNL